MQNKSINVSLTRDVAEVNSIALNRHYVVLEKTFKLRILILTLLM